MDTMVQTGLPAECLSALVPGMDGDMVGAGVAGAAAGDMDAAGVTDAVVGDTGTATMVVLPMAVAVMLAATEGVMGFTAPRAVVGIAGAVASMAQLGAVSIAAGAAASTAVVVPTVAVAAGTGKFTRFTTA